MYPKEYMPLDHYAGPHDENNIVRKDFDDLVYDEKCFISGDFPPEVIYKPSEEILEVMIRTVGINQNMTFEELLDEFGISTLCFLCQDVIKPKEEKFKIPENFTNCIF